MCDISFCDTFSCCKGTTFNDYILFLATGKMPMEWAIVPFVGLFVRNDRAICMFYAREHK